MNPTSHPLRFRVILITAMMVILVTTVAAVGVSAYLAATYTVRDLSRQIISRTTSAIEQRIEILFRITSSESQAIAESIQLSMAAGSSPDLAHTPEQLTEFFYNLMRIHTSLGYISWGLEATGEYCAVIRMPDGSLTIQICRHNAAGALERAEYSKHGPERKLIHLDSHPRYDPRHRPYYQAARDTGQQVWTETYLFSSDTQSQIPGITCATPIYTANGSLLGVLSADFTVEDLCHYLKTVSEDLRSKAVHTTPIALVLERRRSGDLQLIAQPDADMLLINDGANRQLRRSTDLPNDLHACLEEIRSHSLAAPGEFTPIQFDLFRQRYLGGFVRLRGQNMPQWIASVVIPEADLMGAVDKIQHFACAAGLLALVCVIGLSAFLSGRIAEPLKRIAEETNRIGRLDLTASPLPHSSVLEVDQLAMAMEQMKTGLRSFEKFVPADHVRWLLKSGHVARLGGERRLLTIYFADIAGFTPVAETLGPEPLVALISEYFNAISQAIADTGGTVDKYIGDEVMAFWGAPLERADHARAACITAIRSQQRLQQLRAQWKSENKPELHIRIGLNTGEAIVGHMGSDTRLNYTALGDPVNLASRLQSLCKHYGTEILISDHTYKLAGPDIVVRPLDHVSVKGKQEAVLVYELLGLKDELPAEVLDRALLHADALDRFQKRDWAGAIQLCQQELQLCPDDVPATLLLTYCQQLLQNPPDANWTSIRHMTHK